ncbi:hypothetical protein PS847_05445 [Pseudomonas fluorescens]|uniref:Uncharacterized protein n=1 Tax=Pseudomonas fluorescens TaxID=294 RepID=A0A5E7PS65_PSEFL|nr:hypothetical protein PS847_05445 [Pseudomonas fluorescens]
MVVAVLHAGAVGIDPSRDQVQIIVIFVAGNAPEFIALSGDLAVGAVAVGARAARRRSRQDQSAGRVPLLTTDNTKFVLGGNPPAQRIVGKTPHAAVRQGFFDELAELVPHPAVAAAVRVTQRQQLPAQVVVVMGDLAVGIDRFGDGAFSVAPVDPHRITTATLVEKTVAVLVGRWCIVRRNQRDQPSDLVVAVFGNRAQRILLGDQPALLVIGLELLATIGRDLPHQPCALVVDVDFFGTVDVMHGHAGVVIVPDVTGVHLRERRPVPHAARRFALALPLPEEARAAGQLALEDDVMVVVVVAFAVADRVGRGQQALPGIEAVGGEGLLGGPLALDEHLIINRHQLRAVITQQQ